MAVTHNIAAAQTVTAASSLSFAVVVGAGENIAALIGLSWYPLLEAATDSVTFAGQSGTFIQLVVNAGGVAEQYYVKGVTAGTRTCTVVWNTGSVVGVVGVEAMNGVDQTTPLGVKATGHVDPGTSLSVTLPATANDGFVVDTVQVPAPTPTSVTPDASQTSRWSASPGVVPDKFTGAASTKPSGGNVTMTWTISPTRHCVIAAAEFLAAATGKPVNCYTSYGYAADPLPLESFKDPAVQQRIWVNDRRHMQGDL